MYTIEFEADVENGMIKIPAQYKELNVKHIKVIALLENSGTKKLLENKQDEENSQYSDEYIEEHWRELMMIGLSTYDDSKLEQAHANWKNN